MVESTHGLVSFRYGHRVSEVSRALFVDGQHGDQREMSASSQSLRA